MPNQVVKGLADKSGKSVDEVEKAWSKAKSQAKKEYPDLSEDDDKFWKIVTAITKSMIGIKKESFLELLDDEFKILESDIDDRAEDK